MTQPPNPPVGRPAAAVRLPSATIVRRRDYTGDLFLLWLKPGIEFRFVAGQYITIGSGGIERPYSIASAPYEPLIELFIEYVLPEHGGKLTPILHTLQPGDVVTMRPRPKGRFTLATGAANHVMVATVTGIAPYISIIRQYLHDRERAAPTQPLRFFVMQGASHYNEFIYDAELQRLNHEHPDVVQFVCSVSRPHDVRNAAWTGATGRINLLVEEYLDRWRLPREDTLVYLCGNPGMIQDATARLTPQGWSVVSEQFWPIKPGEPA